MKKYLLLSNVIIALFFISFSFLTFAFNHSQNQFLIQSQKETLWQLSKNKTTNNIELIGIIPSSMYVYADSLEFIPKDNIKNISKPVLVEDFIQGTIYAFKNELEIEIFSDHHNFIINYQECDFVLKLCLAAKSIEVSVQDLIVKKVESVNSKVDTPNNKNDINYDTSSYKVSLFESELGFLETNTFLVIIYIFLLGVLLSISPCHFSVYPLIASLLTKEKSKVVDKLGVVISYMLGLFLIFSVITIFLKIMGNQAYLLFKNEYIILISSGLLFYLGLVTLNLINFDIFNLINHKMMKLQDIALSFRKTNLKAFLFGIVSSILTVGCISAPILALIIFLQKYENILLIATILLIFSAGLCFPLFLFSFGIKIIRKLSSEILHYSKLILGSLILLFAVFLLEKLIVNWLVMIMLGMIFCLFAIKSFLIKGNIIFKIIARVLSILGIVYFLVILNFYIKNNKVNYISPFADHFSNEQFISVFNENGSYEELEETILKNDNSVIYFTSKNCTNCKLLDNNISQIDLSLYNLKIIKVDLTNITKAEKEIITKFNIIGTPTLLFFKDGLFSKDITIVGYKDKESLLKRFDWLAN